MASNTSKARPGLLKMIDDGLGKLIPSDLDQFRANESGGFDASSDDVAHLQRPPVSERLKSFFSGRKPDQSLPPATPYNAPHLSPTIASILNSTPLKSTPLAVEQQASAPSSRLTNRVDATPHLTIELASFAMEANKWTYDQRALQLQNINPSQARTIAAYLQDGGNFGRPGQKGMPALVQEGSQPGKFNVIIPCKSAVAKFVLEGVQEALGKRAAGLATGQSARQASTPAAQSQQPHKPRRPERMQFGQGAR